MKISVLVVDDSLFMRKLIVRLIEEDGMMEVVGTAANGAEAVRMVKELRPSVVTLDIEMPVMNGLDALRTIMAVCPTPVVMLSSLTREGARETVAALSDGAIDFIAKPSGSISADLYKVKDELLAKLRAAAQTPSSVLRRLRSPGLSREEGMGITQKAIRQESLRTKPIEQIVAIGTSTGGPKALETVITSLPADFGVPVLVVQHMPPKFTHSLAARLDRMSGVRVVEAEDGQQVQGGTVYIAPGDFHLTAQYAPDGIRIRLHRQPARRGHRPSVDELFESVARLDRLKRHYVIMTGMGSDGARGMAFAKASGAASLIAESKETCVVYGMPKSAVELGCADKVLPLQEIAGAIVRATASR